MKSSARRSAEATEVTVKDLRERGRCEAAKEHSSGGGAMKHTRG